MLIRSQPAQQSLFVLLYLIHCCLCLNLPFLLSAHLPSHLLFFSDPPGSDGDSRLSVPPPSVIFRGTSLRFFSMRFSLRQPQVMCRLLQRLNLLSQLMMLLFSRQMQPFFLLMKLSCLRSLQPFLQNVMPLLTPSQNFL
ncbi:unknown [Roseburia sp. CAG:182]|nr:unknown [Roseburia sp. CAG:182]